MQPDTPYHASMSSIDGIRPRPLRAVVTPSRPQITRAKASRPAAKTPIAASHPRPKLWERLQMPLLIGGGSLAGFLIQTVWFGVMLIVLYGILAMVFRVKSYITFTLALISMGVVIIAMILRPGSDLADTFAAYAFLLLTIGVIALSVEARPGRKRHRHRGR